MIWWWFQWVVKAWLEFRNLATVLFKSGIIPEFIVFIATLGGNQGRCSAQHQHLDACNLLGTFLSYTSRAELKTSALQRKNLLVRTSRDDTNAMLSKETLWKGECAHDWDRGLKKPSCGLFSICPSPLPWFALPSFEPLLSDWAPGWSLAKPVWHEEPPERHHHWRWQPVGGGGVGDGGGVKGGVKGGMGVGGGGESPCGPRLQPSFCSLQPPRQHFELSSPLRISVLLSTLWKKRGRTISLEKVWTDEKGYPCELLPELSLATSKNKVKKLA